jgi:hypothetical protein
LLLYGLSVVCIARIFRVPILVLNGVQDGELSLTNKSNQDSGKGIGEYG